MKYSYLKDNFVSINTKPDGSFHKAIAITKTHPKARLPQRANPTDAGADLFSVETLDLAPGESAIVDTGIGIKIPVGYAGFVMNRSSQRAAGITSYGEGLIDSDYRGPLKVVLFNKGDTLYKIEAGVTKIAQLVIKQIELVDFVDIWNDTERGTGGFGSTDK